MPTEFVFLVGNEFEITKYIRIPFDGLFKKLNLIAGNWQHSILFSIIFYPFANVIITLHHGPTSKAHLFLYLTMSLSVSISALSVNTSRESVFFMFNQFPWLLFVHSININFNMRQHCPLAHCKIAKWLGSKNGAYFVHPKIASHAGTHSFRSILKMRNLHSTSISKLRFLNLYTKCGMTTTISHYMLFRCWEFIRRFAESKNSKCILYTFSVFIYKMF